MKNFEKSDIITEVAYNKNKARFLPRNEQMIINNQLKQKLLRFVNEIKTGKNRPKAMNLFDSMMNDMHGQRVKDLYTFRNQGNHVVAMLCNSIPPELIYGIDNHIPVSVCMGGGEVEKFGDDYTNGMCPVTRSMVGFLNSGMCVFFNLADRIIASDICPNIKKTAAIINEISEDFDVYCIETKFTHKGELNIGIKGLWEWVNKISEGNGLNKSKFIEYAKLYSEIREVYKSIMTLRKGPNPPINGSNFLWAQQLFLVQEPYKLLSALNELKDELIENINNKIGYNGDGTKKRVMLIGPRIMPPFAEIYRLIENNNAIVVCEDIDMGITNVNYKINYLLEKIKEADGVAGNAVQYIMETIDKTAFSCLEDFDIERIVSKVKEFKVDAVITYSYINCPSMEHKTQKISDLLNNLGISCLSLKSDYLEIYDNQDYYMDKIQKFLI